jgi:hypothetical protein
METPSTATPRENANNSETLLLGEKHVEKVIESPYREDVFQAYVTWKALPVMLRNPPPRKVNGETMRVDPVEYAVANGIDDPDLLRLIGLRSQSAFCDEFAVSKDTLTNWNVMIEKRNILEDSRRWSSKLVNNMIMSLYSHAMKKGNPANIKLFLQASANFEERTHVEHRFNAVDSIGYDVIPAPNESKAQA